MNYSTLNLNQVIDIFDRTNIIEATEYKLCHSDYKCERLAFSSALNEARYNEPIMYVTNLLLTTINKAVVFTTHMPTQGEGNYGSITGRITRGVCAYPTCFIEERTDYKDNPPYAAIYNTYYLNLHYIRHDIPTFFETALHDYSPVTGGPELENVGDYRVYDWKEIKGISLALKNTARHRVRAYTCITDRLVHFTESTSDANCNLILHRNKTLNIYSNKAYTEPENECLLLRKCIAVLPYFLELPEDHIVTKLIKDVAELDLETWLHNAIDYLKDIDYIKNYQEILLQKTYNEFVNQRRKSLIDIIQERRIKLEQIREDYCVGLKQLNTANDNLNALTDSQMSLEEFKTLTKDTISKITIDRSTCKMRVHAILNDFDSDAAERILDRQLKQNYFKATDLCYKLLKDLLVKRTLVLHFNEQIIFDLISYNFRMNNRTQYFSEQVNFPNPHHLHYNCWGNYGKAIADCIASGDLLAICMQFKTAIGSLNVCDTPVFNAFENDLKIYLDHSCSFDAFATAEEPNKLLSYKELINYLTKEDTNNEDTESNS